MLNISLTALRAHKRRLVGTFTAVFLGVAFLSGTFVLSDTMRSSIGDFFVEANAGTDTVVRNAIEVSEDPGDTQRGTIDARLVDRIRAIDGVAAAAPVIQGFGQPVGTDGDAVDVNGPRTAASWIEDRELNPYRIVEGRPPRADDEVVVNRGTAKEGDLHVGDRMAVLTPDRIAVRVVGIATFGSRDGFGGSAYTAFTLRAAERLLTGAPGRVSTISVRAEDGVSQAEITDRIRSVLPRDVEALTGAELTAESQSDVDEGFLDMFQAFLTVFAAVALLVASFSIYNTFSIIVAQRTRESALLRAVGASRGQILFSVALEALLVGIAASVAGLIGGLGFAAALKALFAGVGFDLPARGLTFKATTVAVAIPVGLLVTLAAGVVPAIKASRVPPIAALRDVALDRSGVSRRRVAVGAVVAALGVILVIAGLASGGAGMAGAGAVLTLAGMVVLGPTAATPAAGIIGAPLGRLRGITGSLARRNAMRNPRRTAAAATALMVGVGVVTVFTLFAASLKASIDDSVSESFAGDMAITAGRGFADSGFSTRLAGNVERIPQVSAAAGVGLSTARLDGDAEQVSIGHPARLAQVLRFGSLDDLGPREIAVADDAAEDRGWKVGSPVSVRFGDGAVERLRVGAIYSSTGVLGDYMIGRADWMRHAEQDIDGSVLIKLAPGADEPAVKAAVERASQPYGAPDVQNREEYIDSRAGPLNQLLALVYVMLALAIGIALMGIANTLSLSVHERTRELGLLRAVGQTRSQLRAMVRWESFIIAAFGTAGGTAVGIFLGWALVQAAGDDLTAFSAPPVQIVAVLVIGAIVGILAGVRPARRAARMDVLRAIAAE